MPPLGALYVATAIERQGDWEVEVIDELNWASKVPKRALRADPIADHVDLQSRRPAQAVGFYGGLTSTIPRLLRTARFYKGLGIPTVAGGAHVDAVPEESLRNGIDVVVHGEGEETIVEILRAWSGGAEISDIKGISYFAPDGGLRRTEKRPPICDLDAILPTPNFDLMVERRRPLKIAPFERTRGCNYKCEFCIVNDRFGPSRSGSPERVAAEVEKRVQSGYRTFFCVDDNFVQNRKETLRLLELLIDIQKRYRVKLSLTVQVRSSVGRDEELMRVMRAAGVTILCIGLESPISEELKGMEKRQTPEQIERDIRAIHRQGFMIHGMFIFGYPIEHDGELLQLSLRERADRFYTFIKRTAIDSIQVLKPVPVPGSRLAERLSNQGRIFPLNLVGWDKYDGNFLCFMPEGVSARELQEQATRILQRFYSPMSFLRFPVLALETPVEILRLGFRSARDFARDPKAYAQAAVRDRQRRYWALRAGFADACEEIRRRWRNAVVRSMGCMIVSNWIRDAQHEQFLRMLQKLQTILLRRDAAAME
jgi:anaerobic magnesium-protoporphyrin IX monomethyl ester cyclase